MDNHHFSICGLSRSSPIFGSNTPEISVWPRCHLPSPARRSWLSSADFIGICLHWCGVFNLVLGLALTMIWAKWQQGERKWLILFSVVTASSLSLGGSVSDGHGQLCTVQGLALLVHNHLELSHMQENNRVWGEGTVQELNQAIK